MRFAIPQRHCPARQFALLALVADEATAEHAAAAAADLGGATGFSHNAGIQRYGSAAETTPDLWDEVIGVNLRGAYLMARALLAATGWRSRGPCVFMASVQGLADAAKCCRLYRL